MAKVIVDKSGKIIVVDDKGVKHSTSFKVTSDSSQPTIKKLVGTAIKMNKGHPGVSGLYGKVDSIAKKIHKQMQGKPVKEEKPETKKPEKKTKEKKTKEKQPKTKKEKTPKKTEKKPAETTPKKKTVTVSVSGATVTKLINLAEKKKDKKLQDELNKLAGSYTNVKEYVEKNSEAVMIEVFNIFHADEYFELHLSTMAVDDPAFEELISQLTGKKLTKSSGAELIELANTAMRSYISFEMETNDKLSKEIGAIGGIDPIGPMDSKLFFASMLYLRRMKNPNASLLKLNLVETVEKPVEKIIEKEKPKVKYKL